MRSSIAGNHEGDKGDIAYEAMPRNRVLVFRTERVDPRFNSEKTVVENA